MKKIILVLCLLLGLVNVNGVDAVAYTTLSISGDVEGYIGESIDVQSVYITINSLEGYVFDEDKLEQEDFLQWFIKPDGYPDGVDFTDIFDGLEVSYVGLSNENKTIELSFTGLYEYDEDTDKPEPNTYTMNAYIPVGMIYYHVNEDIEHSIVEHNEYNEDIIYLDSGSDASYIIKDFDVKYKQDYTVSGYVGEQLTSQTIHVIVEHGGLVFDESMLNEYLPDINGMSVQVTSVDDKEIEITYTGTPLNESQELIHTLLEKEYLDPSGRDITVPDRQDVKFNIVSRPVIEQPVYIIPKTGID